VFEIGVSQEHPFSVPWGGSHGREERGVLKAAILADMKLRLFMTVNNAETEGVGIGNAQAENCSFAGSKICGGDNRRRVCMTI
jgi:hypothetical protein